MIARIAVSRQRSHLRWSRAVISLNKATPFMGPGRSCAFQCDAWDLSLCPTMWLLGRISTADSCDARSARRQGQCLHDRDQGCQTSWHGATSSRSIAHRSNMHEIWNKSIANAISPMQCWATMPARDEPRYVRLTKHQIPMADNIEANVQREARSLVARLRHWHGGRLRLLCLAGSIFRQM